MKKFLLIALVVTLVGGFILSYGRRPPLAKEKGKYGGIFKVAMMAPAVNFGDPLNIRGPDRFYCDFAMQKLIEPSESEQISEYEPLLATSWELSPDKKYYTFYLRKGVKFHDGTDFNAQAVKWNLDRVVAASRALAGKPPGGPPPGMGPPPGGPPPGGPPPGGPPPGGPPTGPPGEVTLSNVTSIDVIDDYTVRLNLSSWDNMILFDLAITNSCRMISPTAYKKHGAQWAATHPVGTGPFKFKAYRRNVYVKYERFDDYWEEGLPYLDGAEILFIVDPMTAIASLKAGEVDAINEIDLETAHEMKKGGHFDVAWIRGLNLGIVASSNDPNSVWADKRMREALEYSVDKEKIVKGLGRGFIQPIYEIIPTVPGNPDTVPRKYDPDKARKLMAEAGHPKGVKAKLSIPAEGSRDLFIALQGDLAKVGIELELEPLTRPAFMALMFRGGSGNDLRVGVWPGGLGLGIPEGLFTATSVMGPDMKRPAGTSELIEKALVEEDIDKQIALMERMEELAYKDAMFIPLWTNPLMGAYSPDLRDYIAFFKDGPDLRLQRAWFSKK